MASGYVMTDGAPREFARHAGRAARSPGSAPAASHGGAADYATEAPQNQMQIGHIYSP
jgi:hypothetical protein